MPNALGNLVRLCVYGNDLMDAAVDALVVSLDRGAMPHLRTVVGLGGGAFGAEVVSLRESKRMRDKLNAIDWSKPDAVQHLGPEQKKDEVVEHLDKVLQMKVANLKRLRAKNSAK